MNIAIDIETKKVVKANELPFIDNLREIKFSCIDINCPTPVVPSAFKKGNKQIPHFRKLKGFEHVLNCEYGIKNSIYEKGLNGHRISNQEKKIIGYPSNFNIKKTDENNEIKILEDSDVGKNVVNILKKTKNNSFLEFSNFKGNTVSAIDRIVDFYLEHPANRDSKIKIDGINISYDDLFKVIVAGKKDLGKSYQFYYAKVLKNKDKIKTKSLIEGYKKIIIKLYAADFELNDSRVHYEIIFNKDSVKKRKLSRILNSFDIAFEQSKFDSNENKDLFVFFIGNAPKNKNEVAFNLVNGYICFRYTDIRPSNSNTDF